MITDEQAYDLVIKNELWSITRKALKHWAATFWPPENPETVGIPVHMPYFSDGEVCVPSPTDDMFLNPKITGAKVIGERFYDPNLFKIIEEMADVETFGYTLITISRDGSYKKENYSNES